MKKPTKTAPAKRARKPAATTSEGDREAANMVMATANKLLADAMDQVTNLRHRNDLWGKAVSDLMLLQAAAQREISVRDGYIAALQGQPVPSGNDRLLFAGSVGQLEAFSVADFLGILTKRHRARSAAADAVKARAEELRPESGPTAEAKPTGVPAQRWQPL